MAAVDKDQIFTDEEIRGTTFIESAPVNTGEFNAETIVVYNDLDKNVLIQLQGSLDGGANWLDMGDPFTVDAGTKDYATVTDYFPMYQITAKCSVAPTTGNLNAWMLKAGA